MTELRDQKDLKIHDVHPISDEVIAARRLHFRRGRALTVNVVRFRLGESKFSRASKCRKGRRRFEMDTPGINEHSKTSTRRVEIGQHEPCRGTPLIRKCPPS